MQHKQKSPTNFYEYALGGARIRAKLTYTRLEDNLILRHRGDRYLMGGQKCFFFFVLSGGVAGVFVCFQQKSGFCYWARDGLKAAAQIEKPRQEKRSWCAHTCHLISPLSSTNVSVQKVAQPLHQGTTLDYIVCRPRTPCCLRLPPRLLATIIDRVTHQFILRQALLSFLPRLVIQI